MSDAPRCEPPEELRGVDGWHWLTLFGHTKPAPYLWQPDGPGLWCGIEKYGCTATWAYERGHRYIAPVTPPAEVEALRARVAELAELVRSSYSEGWQDGQNESDPLVTATDGWDCSAASAALEPKP